MRRISYIICAVMLITLGTPINIDTYATASKQLAVGDNQEEVSGEGSNNTSGNGSGEASGDGSGKVSGDASGNGSGGVSGDASGDGSGGVSGEASGNGSGDASGDPEQPIKEPYQGIQASKPQLIFASAVSLWVNVPLSGNEYGIRPLGSSEEFRFQSTNLFFGLSPHTSYEIVIRYAATDTVQAGGASEILVASTDDWNYTIRYHLNGGVNNAGNALSYQTGVAKLPLYIPHRSGYQFVGWYQNAALTKAVTKFNTAKAKDSHLYAKWKTVNKNKVTGIKLKKKGKNKLVISFTKKSFDCVYEVQYSTSAKFARKKTITKQISKNQYTTGVLLSGTKYYVRVRSIAYDSCGERYVGAYSTVASATLPASGAVARGTMKAGKAVAGAVTSKKKTGNTKTTKKKAASDKKPKASADAKKAKKKKKCGTVYLSVKDKKQLTMPKALKKQVQGNWKQVTLKSSKPGVASVSATGCITAKKLGKTKVKIIGKDTIYLYDIVVEKVKLSVENKTLIEGNKTQAHLLDAVSMPKWKSSDSHVLKVSKKGVISAASAGKATVTATYHNHTYKVTVTVITQEQYYISKTKNVYFHNIYKKLLPGESYTPAYTVSPEHLQPSELVWGSTKPAVATVAAGVITAQSVGEATIYVRCKNKIVNMKVQVVATEAEKQAVTMISHRGSLNAPENTIPAFELAAKAGFSTVETDIRFTKDNVPILLHDASVNRTSDALEDVNVSSLTYDECMALDFGSYFGEAYKDTKIVRLDDFLKLCQTYQLHCYIEIKGSMYQEQCKLLGNLVRYYGMEGKTTFISFSANSLYSIREVLPGVRLGYLCDTFADKYIDTLKDLQNGKNQVFLDLKYEKAISLSNLQKIGNAGIMLECYTINSMELLNQAVSQGVANITTDAITPAIYESGRDLLR